VKRFAVFTFGAVLLATAVLAVLGYLSLRNWEASAELLVREQARDMAAMAAQKIEMTVLKNEEDYLSALQRLVLDPSFRPELIDAWKATRPLVDRVYLVDRPGRLLYPPGTRVEDAGILRALLAEIPQGFWDRGGRRHFVVDDHVVLGAVLHDAARRPVLAVLDRDEHAVTRDVVAKTLGGLEGPSVLAVLDRADRTVYASRPLDGAQRLLTVSFGEALPRWRVALYQPAGVSPREAVRRQTMIFQKFYRVGRSETQGRRGSGVGLALVKHIVEAHGGRVSGESRPGKGSRFTLHLPVGAPEIR
jgi:Histidine kinase-, DNA gyrase B-, and HSP90-like ATPase